MATDWREKARRLGEGLPLERLHPAVLGWLKERNREEPWGIACSGGADSICLVLLLYANFSDDRERMRVLHFNHRLRGEESDRDAVLVEGLARGLGLASHTGSWEGAPPEGTASEEAARDARFAFFEERLESREGGVVFLGHQRDDIIESQLMRLSRGAGTEGLAAPRPVSVLPGGRVRLRPLLAVGAGEIRKALRGVGVPWREDRSNRENGFYRSRIRQSVLPVWADAAPFDIYRGAAASRKLLEEDNAALEQWVDRLMAGMVSESRFPARRLRDEPAAVLRRALNRWLGARGLRERLSARAFQRLLEALAGDGPFRCSAGADRFLFYDGRELVCEGPPAEDRGAWRGEAVLPAGAELHFPGGRVLRTRTGELDEAERASIRAGACDPSVECCVDAEVAEGGGLVVRPWRAGDRYTPLGAPGSRKLQDLFTDKGIDPAERRKLPVVCTGDGTVIWCPGLSPAEKTKIGEITKRVVRLTYCGGRAS